MIPVTKPYLPSREKLERYIDGVYERNWLTNNGPLVQELTMRLEEYLGVENLLLVSNGTLALQVAYRALGIGGHGGEARQEAITTPFSFIATAASLKWEGIQPIFTDIDPNTWCIDPKRIESAITPYTRAIVPVHVFGNACDVEVIDSLAGYYGLKVVYDGAHAFGVTYKERSLLSFGDATTLSFHATKLFHTVEGGAIIFKRAEDLARAKRIINFGLAGSGEVLDLGINAKMNELQAAMGLCVLDEIQKNQQGRAIVWMTYRSRLHDAFELQHRHAHVSNNHAYFPVLMESESQLIAFMDRFNEAGIEVRRYFYPTLDAAAYLGGSADNGIALHISRRILCLPLYASLAESEVERILGVLRR